MARGPLVVVSAWAAHDFAGGAERVAWEEARLLARDRAVVVMSTSAPASAGVDEVRIGAWLGRLHDPRTGARSPAAKLAYHGLLLFNPGTFVEALAVFRRLRPSIVHTHNLQALSPSVWLAARLAGARVVHTHHDLALLCQRATMTRQDGRYCEERTAACAVCRTTRLVKLAQTPLVDREVFPGRWLRERLGRQGDVVRPFGVAEPAAPPGTFSVLFLGRLVPSKGIHVLLEAASRARIRLVVAGHGPLEPTVKAAPRVTYAGEVGDEERARLLAEASVVVVPSLGPDASPLVFFEALAAGIPAVLSDIGGLTELAEYGSAVLVPPGDPGALAEVLLALAGDPVRLEALRRAALARRGEASTERFAGELEAVLARLGEQR